MSGYNNENNRSMNRYREDESNRLSSAHAYEQTDDEVEFEEEERQRRLREECYDLPKRRKSRTRLWSVLSVVASALSVLLCAFYYVSLPLALMGIGLSLFSKMKLGYFDRCGTIGLVVGIVGCVFGIFSIVGSCLGVLGFVSCAG